MSIIKKRCIVLTVLFVLLFTSCAKSSDGEFLQDIKKLRGDIELTAKLRESFEQFARENAWSYIPDMNGYESFVSSSFAPAVFYILQLNMDQKAKISKGEMQQALISHFAAKTDYKPMVHQGFFKFANYQDGYYSAWIEERREKEREFYLLTGLTVQEADGDSDLLDVTVAVSEYYLNDTTYYEPGAFEKYIQSKAAEMDMNTRSAAQKLVSSGEIFEMPCSRSWETTMVLNTKDMSFKFLKNKS